MWTPSPWPTFSRSWCSCGSGGWERGLGILLTDHSVRETLSITDRSYIIDAGKLLAAGPPKEIVENELVRKTYLGENFSMPELDDPAAAPTAPESPADPTVE